MLRSYLDWLLFDNFSLRGFKAVVFLVCFCPMRYSASKINGDHLRVGITAIQVSDPCSETLLVVDVAVGCLEPIVNNFV